ncbi:MAG: DUF6526 family protein [Pyrinomonadaceae bacterium]
MAEPQNFKNHVRWYPLVHFVITPLLFVNLIWQIVRLTQEKTWDHGENVLLAVTLMLMSLAARLQALRAQDRVIRLEERLRYNEILPPDLAAQAANLKNRTDSRAPVCFGRGTARTRAANFRR